MEYSHPVSSYASFLWMGSQKGEQSCAQSCKCDPDGALQLYSSIKKVH